MRPNHLLTVVTTALATAALTVAVGGPFARVNADAKPRPAPPGPTGTVQGAQFTLTLLPEKPGPGDTLTLRLTASNPQASRVEFAAKAVVQRLAAAAEISRAMPRPRVEWEAPCPIALEANESREFTLATTVVAAAGDTLFAHVSGGGATVLVASVSLPRAPTPAPLLPPAAPAPAQGR